MSGSFTTPGDDVDPDLLVAPKDVPRYAKHVRALADKTRPTTSRLNSSGPRHWPVGCPFWRGATSSLQLAPT